MSRTNFLMGCIFLASVASSFADEFSLIAEEKNMLSHPVQHPWSVQRFPVSLEISGYVKAEGIYDSRQDLTDRDGQFLYFPLNKQPDVNGRDINKRGDLDQYAIQTRLRFEAFGPPVDCFDTRGYIEGDFFGTTDDTVDTYRLRHGYISLESDWFDFLAGQTWHPMYLPAEAPDTISFNTGTPIQPFARNPQFRGLFHDQHLDILVAAIGWIGDRPFGPIGPTAKYFRDSMMPDMHLQARYKIFDEENYVGGAVDVMRIVPRLVSNLDYKEVSPFTNVSGMVYSRFTYGPVSWYSKFTYAQNAAIFDMIGGYAVHTVDPLTDVRTYTPLRTLSFWSEIMWQGDIEPALFIGFAKNLGAGKTVIESIGPEITVYGLGTNISTVFRASPRIRFYIKSLVLGAELEYTRANYGIPNQFGKPINTVPVGNTRLLVAAYYIF